MYEKLKMYSIKLWILITQFVKKEMILIELDIFMERWVLTKVITKSHSSNTEFDG